MKRFSQSFSSFYTLIKSLPIYTFPIASCVLLVGKNIAREWQEYFFDSHRSNICGMSLFFRLSEAGFNNTAELGEDYEITENISFSTSDPAGPKNITISLIKDNQIEAQESFKLKILNETDDVFTNNDTDTAEVIIQNSDCKYKQLFNRFILFTVLIC